MLNKWRHYTVENYCLLFRYLRLFGHASCFRFLVLTIVTSVGNTGFSGPTAFRFHKQRGREGGRWPAPWISLDPPSKQDLFRKDLTRYVESPSPSEDPECAWSLHLTNMFTYPVCAQLSHSSCWCTHVSIHCVCRTFIDASENVFFLPGGGDGCWLSQVYHPGL